MEMIGKTTTDGCCLLLDSHPDIRRLNDDLIDENRHFFAAATQRQPPATLIAKEYHKKYKHGLKFPPNESGAKLLKADKKTKLGIAGIAPMYAAMQMQASLSYHLDNQELKNAEGKASFNYHTQSPNLSIVDSAETVFLSVLDDILSSDDNNILPISDQFKNHWRLTLLDNFDHIFKIYNHFIRLNNSFEYGTRLKYLDLKNDQKLRITSLLQEANKEYLPNYSIRTMMNGIAYYHVKYFCKALFVMLPESKNNDEERYRVHLKKIIRNAEVEAKRSLYMISLFNVINHENTLANVLYSWLLAEKLHSIINFPDD